MWPQESEQRTVTLTVVREFRFDVEVPADHPPITSPEQFEEEFGPFNVGDDSMLVSEDLDDPAA
jgi:hypothetical protein